MPCMLLVYNVCVCVCARACARTSSRFIKDAIKLVPHSRIIVSTGAHGMADSKYCAEEISVKADKTGKVEAEHE